MKFHHVGIARRQIDAEMSDSAILGYVAKGADPYKRSASNFL
jgi:hypothetical protein